MTECVLLFQLVLTYCRKEAIQKTIMSMTLGKDVSSLFPDVLKNIATADLDQKKLVYLYLMYVNPSTNKSWKRYLLLSEGTTLNLTPTSVSSLSILLFRTLKTRTL
jgi:hypothetical protein